MLNALLQFSLFIAVLLLLAWPLGQWLAVQMQRPASDAGWLNKKLAFNVSMSWKQYAAAILGFNLIGLTFLFILQLVQAGLPLNPHHNPAPTWHSAFNTAASFVTNTNWQGYAGETGVSYITQMVGLGVQNFLSAATGIAVAFALIRGLTNTTTQSLGNAWQDIWRATVYLLLPLSVILAAIFIQQGVIQNLADYTVVHTLQGATQTIPQGPVASQEAIKVLGTNGGGFFNANSAHPFENPTPLTNFLQMLAIFLIPAALCSSLGKISGNWRHGAVLLTVMSVLFLLAFLPIAHSELIGNPWLQQQLGAQGGLADAANYEGKESRFGIVGSALFIAVTTSASCGAVNAMHDSLTPIGGMVPTLLMQLGEVVFGGVGSGLYGMLLYALLAVFVAGLMIGRTPEYLGKKIEPFDMKMTVIGLLVTPLLVLLGTAIAVSFPESRASVANPSAHGFSEILYAFSSAANNNGSAFAGLSANTPFYNVALGLVMLLGRFGVILPVLALAGSLGAKPRLPATPGTLPTQGPLFVGLLIGTVLMVGALTFIPALALGPVIEQLWMQGAAVTP